jgi:hypothetical protein
MLFRAASCRVPWLQSFLDPSLGRTKLERRGGGGVQGVERGGEMGGGWEVVVGLWDSQQSNGLGVRKRQSKSSRPVGQ